MIYASYDHNMLTFEVFLSLFFLFHFFLCMFAKNYTSIAIYEKSFFSVHLHSYTRKTLSLYINMVYIKPLFLFKDFFFLFQHTLIFYTKISLYTLIAHTQEFLFTYYLYTQNLFIHFLYTKTLFFSLYTDMTFCLQRLFLFLFLVLS